MALAALLIVAFLSAHEKDPNSVAAIAVPSAVPSVPATIIPSTEQPTIVRTTPTMPVNVQTLDEDFVTWKYHAEQNNRTAGAIITYKADNLQELTAYAEANRTLVAGLAGNKEPISVIVTFRTYMSPDQLRQWARDSGLLVTGGMMRIVQGNGQLGTLGLGLGTDDDPLPQAELDAELENIRNQSGTGGIREIPGIYSVEGTVDSSRIGAITSNPMVYMADVTRTVVYNRLLAAGWGELIDRQRIQVVPPNPFWRMEELGLDNFRR